MKKLFTLFFITALLAFALPVSAANYDMSGSHNIGRDSSKRFELTYPISKLTYSVSVPGSASGSTYVTEIYEDGSTKEIFSKDVPYKAFTTATATYSDIAINPKAVAIQFSASGTLPKTIYGISVTMATYLESASTDITLPATEIGSASNTVLSFDHSNMNSALTVTSSNPSVFVPATTTISTAGVGLWKNGEQVQIDFRPTTAGTHTATITVTDGTHTLTYNLTGTCTKKAQTITWAEGTDIIPETYELENAATATSRLAITYTSDNTAVINVVDDRLVGLAAGTANITATQAGDDTWAAVSATKAIAVTALEIQTITWTQDLLRLMVGDAAVALTPTASSGLTDFTFEVADPSIASVADGMLTPLAKGTTTITARQAGNTTYAPAFITLKIRVYEVGTECIEYVINDQSEHWIGSYTINLTKPASKLSYRAWLRATDIGNITIKQNFSNGTSTTIHEYGLSNMWTDKDIQENDIIIDPTAISLTFSASGTYQKKIYNIIVDQATYFNIDKTEIAGATQVLTTYNNSIVVDYSNISDLITISHTNSDFTLTSAEDLNTDCGDFGTRTIGISLTPNAMGTFLDTIIIDGASHDIRIPVAIEATRLTQAITWNQDFAATAITDVITLNATSSSSLPVSYTISDETIAAIDADGHLSFLGEGTVTITATQAGNDIYFAAQEMTKTITLARITPSVTVWPTYNSVVYQQTLADCDLTGGVASVEGTFAWKNDLATVFSAAGNSSQTIVFTPANTAYYNTVETTVDVAVAKATQTITWEQDFTGTLISDIVILNASTSAEGLAVTYSINNADIATLDGNTLLFNAEGTVVVTASQPGDENFEAATPVSKTITLALITPEITSAPVAADIVYGQTLAESTLTGGEASAQGSFAWANPDNIPDAGTHTADVIFTPDNEIDYSTVTLQVSVNVAQAPQTITWDQDFTDALLPSATVTLSATSSSANAVVYTITADDADIATLEGNTLTFTGTGSITVSASIPATANYLAATPVDKTITVARPVATVTAWPTAGNIISYGELVTTIYLNGGEANIEGVFQFTHPDSIYNAGTHSADITFVPTSADYQPVSSTIEISITKAENLIFWDQDLQNLRAGDTIVLNAYCTSGEKIDYSLDDYSENVILRGDTLIIINAVDVIGVVAFVPESDNYQAAGPQTKTLGYSTTTDVALVSKTEIAIYPNPATDFVNVTSASAIRSIAVYTATGTLVVLEEVDTDTASIQVSQLPAGIYTVVVATDTERTSHQIIKR